MLAELGGGRVATGVLDAYPVHRRPLTVPLRLERIRRVLGACPPRGDVGGILRGLGFPATEKDGGFEVVVPAFRRDVAIEDDLVEEVARVWGYGQIPSTLPSGALALTRRPRALVARDVARRALAGAGCREAVTLSMIDPAQLRHLGLAPDDPRVVRLQNPLGADRSVLRPTLLLGLLEAVATNVRRQAPDVRLFEIGRVFEGRGADELPREDTRVAIVLTGLREPRAWYATRARADAFDVKGAAEGLVDALGRGEVTVEPVAVPYLEDGRAVSVLVQGTPVGTLGELHPDVQRAFDLPQPVFVAELSLDAHRGPAGPGGPVPAPRPPSRDPAGPGGGRRARRAIGQGDAGDRGHPRKLAASRWCCSTCTRALRSGPAGRASPMACSTRPRTGRSPTPRSTGRTARWWPGFGRSSAPRCAVRTARTDPPTPGARPAERGCRSE